MLFFFFCQCMGGKYTDSTSSKLFLKLHIMSHFNWRVCHPQCGWWVHLFFFSFSFFLFPHFPAHLNGHNVFRDENAFSVLFCCRWVTAVITASAYLSDTHWDPLCILSAWSCAWVEIHSFKPHVGIKAGKCHVGIRIEMIFLFFFFR